MALSIVINKVATAASFAAGTTVATAVASGGTTYVYSLATGSDKFAINSSTGVITVIANMNASNIASFSVTATEGSNTITSDVVYPNIQASIQNKFNKTNHIYKITKNIDLGNCVLTIPSSCTLDFQGGSFYTGRIDINNNVTVKNIKYILDEDPLHSLVLKGSNINIIGGVISTYSKKYAAIRLNGCDTVNIENVLLDGDFGEYPESAGIFCSSKASNIYINNVDVPSAAFGVLFNDATSEQGDNYRVFDGVTYTGSIGSNLTISNSRFSKNRSTTGDGVEINCPDFGFKNLLVSGCTVYKLQGVYGLGIGMSSIDGVIVTNNNIMNANAAQPAIHIENSTNFNVSNNNINSSSNGIGIITSKFGIVKGNLLVNVNNAIVVDSTATGISEHVTFEDNIVSGGVGYIIQVIGSDNVKFIRNNIFNYLGSFQIVTVTNTRGNSNTNLTFKENLFGKSSDNSNTVNAFYIQGEATIDHIRNIPDGVILNVTLSSTNRVIDYSFRLNDNVGVFGVCRGNPNGYLQSSAGSFAIDVSSGILWVGKDSSSWIPFSRVATTTGDNSAYQVAGTVVFDTTIGKCIFYSGTEWLNMDGSKLLPKAGTTAERPAIAQGISYQYYDTTLSKPIWWDGTTWKDATGATV